MKTFFHRLHVFFDAPSADPNYVPLRQRYTDEQLTNRLITCFLVAGLVFLISFAMSTHLSFLGLYPRQFHAKQISNTLNTDFHRDLSHTEVSKVMKVQHQSH